MRPDTPMLPGAHPSPRLAHADGSARSGACPRPEGTVAPSSPQATDVAARILREGGNAVDAAAAAAWALSVCEPSESGLGGQASILLSFPGGETVVIDGHSRGPAGLSRRQVDQESQRKGIRACTIPSLAAAVGAAHAEYGRLSLAATLEPAIGLASEGAVVTRLMRRHIQWCRIALAESPGLAETFLPGGKPPARGSVLRQPKLARTLRRLAAEGIADFYRGGIARDIAEDMERNGGLITLDDLRDFRLTPAREPLQTTYRGHRIVSTPPPGGGIQLLLGLKVAEAVGLDAVRTDEDWYETVALIVQAVFRERARWPIRPDRVPASLRAWMLSAARAQEVASTLRDGGEGGARLRGEAERGGNTTHLCVVDRDGLVVSLTQSIQSLFGAKVANDRLGFVYNNYLCTCPRFRHPSRLRPNAVPQSNAAPTIVFRRESPRIPLLVAGAAGSRRITSSLLQVITRVVGAGQELTGAVDAPRIHATLGGRAFLEKRIATEPFVERLRRSFPQVVVKAARSYSMGAVQALARDERGTWTGAAAPRREGTVHGD